MIELLCFTLLLDLLVPGSLSCQPPDVPVGGTYTPMQKKYLLGDRVIFTCKGKFFLNGKVSRSCQDNGQWTGSTPFCDSPTTLKHPRATPTNPQNSVLNVVDNNINTCFRSAAVTGQSLEVFLEKPKIINLVLLFLPKGKMNFYLTTMHDKREEICSGLDRDLEASQWITLECNDNRTVASSLRIADKSSGRNSLAVCEIEAYVEDDDSCKDPPEIFIPNGYLEVSRSKAILRCVEGFREGVNTRIICDENKKWSRSNLQCIEILCETPVGNASSFSSEWRIEGEVKKPSVGTRKRLQCNQAEFDIIGTPDIVTCRGDGTWTPTNATCTPKEKNKLLKIIGISVAVAIVVLIFVCLGLTLYCIYIQKGKQVVVVYTPSDSSAATLKGVTSSEGEYASIYYETPALPTTPPPKRLNHVYVNPVDTITKTKQLPADIAFGTLKYSNIYGK